MITEQALTLAGDGAHLVAAARGRVTHVRLAVDTHPLCRTRARQLRVLPPVSSLTNSLPRLCARCSTRLASRDGGRVEQPTTRAGYRTTYGDLTQLDVWYGLELADTPAEVDAAAHLALALFGYPACTQPVDGRTCLNDQVIAARIRVHGFPESHYEAAQRFNDLALAAAEARKAQAKQAREERRARGLAWDRTKTPEPTP